MPDTQQPYKRHKFKFNDEFKVVVGADVCVDTQSYNVPKNVLVKSSDFLRKACNKGWAEGQTKVVHLPEAKPEPFEVYLQYLYSRDIVLAEEIKFPAAGDKSKEAREDVPKAQVLVIDTYILADMLLDIDAKNALVDQLVYLTKRGRSLLPVSVIQDLFAATTKESPMRQLLIDSVAFFMSMDDFRTHAHTFSNEFKDEVILAVMQSDRGLVEKEPGFNPYRCDYHEHDEEHPECD